MECSACQFLTKQVSTHSSVTLLVQTPQGRACWLVLVAPAEFCLHFHDSGGIIKKGHTFFLQICPWIPSPALNAAVNNERAEGSERPGVLPPPATGSSSPLTSPPSPLSPAIFLNFILTSLCLFQGPLPKFHSYYVRCNNIAPFWFLLWKYDPLRKGTGTHTSHLKNPSKVFSCLKSHLSWDRFCHSPSLQKEGSQVSVFKLLLFS